MKNKENCGASDRDSHAIPISQLSRIFLQLSSSPWSAIISCWALRSYLPQNMEEVKSHHPFEDRSYSLSAPVSPSQSSSSGSGEPHKMKKLERKGASFAHRVREHVKMGPNFSETVKGKLSVGAKIIKKGGRHNIFKDIFGVSDGEKLLKASQCYLSTTAGPIAGTLFISTHKISFCSDRSITLHSSPSLITIPYKVSIPVKKIKAANETENINNPSHKYIHLLTQDDFEFWFMGFVRYEKAAVNLQRAIAMSR